MYTLSPTVKGVIGGLFMIITGLLLYFNNIPETSPLQYLGYFIFGLVIVWSIYAYAKNKGQVSFGQLFNQGFKCFVVVALMMAVFTIIFYKTNTKLIEEKAALTKEQLLKTEKNRTPDQINEMVASGKKNFAVIMASVTIFQHLFIGAIVSVACAGALSLRQKK